MQLHFSSSKISSFPHSSKFLYISKSSFLAYPLDGETGHSATDFFLMLTLLWVMSFISERLLICYECLLGEVSILIYIYDFWCALGIIFPFHFLNFDGALPWFEYIINCLIKSKLTFWIFTGKGLISFYEEVC